MSDVVLFYPRTGLDVKKVSVGLPLPLLTIASELHQDFSIKIIDQRVDAHWEQTLINELKTKPLCFGVTAMTGHQIFHGLAASRIVREYSEGVKIVWGGMHVTLTPDESIKHPLVDIVVKGDGEWVFRDLVRALKAGTSLDEVGGLYWKKNGEVKVNSCGLSVVLDQTLAYPFHLINIEDYVEPGEYLYPGVKRVLPFMGSRGCPFKCTFCSEPVLTKVYKMMKPELVHERTAYMADKFKLDMILFYDEEFFVNARWATKIAELIDGKFKWWTQTRANDLLKVDLQKMEKCGLYAIAPGLESGSDRILKFIKKEETVKEYREANHRLSKTGIQVTYNMMMGFPTETLDELYETVDFTMELMKTNPNAYVNSLSPFTPLPGTELTEQSKQFGFVKPNHLEGWIETSRHNLKTPWLDKNIEMYRSLSYTSKFIGRRAQMALQTYWWIPKFIFNFYSWLIQRRYRRRNFRETWDVKFIQFVHKNVVNPVLNLSKLKENSSVAPKDNDMTNQPPTQMTPQTVLT